MHRAMTDKAKPQPPIFWRFKQAEIARWKRQLAGYRSQQVRKQKGAKNG